MLSSTLHRLCPIVVALLTLLAGCAGGNNTVFEEVVEKIYTVEPNADVSIQNLDGAVLVYGSDANEIRVQCVKKAYSHDRLNQIAVDVTTKPGGVSIITKFPPPPRWLFSDHSGTVECTVVIPATASISAIELNAGEVLLESMRGSEVRARIHDGRIFVRNCFTNLKLAVNRGALTVSYEWWEEKKFSAQMTMKQGNAWIWLPSDAAFHLFAETAHGRIANDFNNVPLTGNPSASGMKFDQIINGGTSTAIQVQVGKGDIKVGEANP